LIDAKKAKELSKNANINKFKDEIETIDKEIIRVASEGHDGVELCNKKYLEIYKHIKKRYRRLGYKVRYNFGNWEYRVEPSITIKWRGF